MNEIVISEENTLPEGYTFERAIPQELPADKMALMSDEKRDLALLDKYGGEMPLSWIAEVSEAYKEPTVKNAETETVCRIELDIRKSTSFIVIYPNDLSQPAIKEKIFHYGCPKRKYRVDAIKRHLRSKFNI